MSQMSGCGTADRTARWTTSEPRWTIRRTAAIVAASLLLLVVAGVPAWAQASIAPAEVEADTDTTLTLTVPEPGEDNEEYGDTARVVVRAPTGFSGMVCGEMPVGWSCTPAEDGTHLTLTRTSPVGLATTRDFGFTVHTAAVNGQYAFRVTQADGPPNEDDPPTTVSSRPAVTVIGGDDPPEPDPEPDPEAQPTPPADDGGSQDDGGTNSDPQPDDTIQDDGAQDGGDTASDASSSDTNSTDGTSGGSTAPRRTEGRASGTTLEVTPGEPTDDDPSIATPDVADDPAIAPPDGADTTADDDSTAVAATGTQASEDPRGAPWQQWVGAAMLLAGGAVVAIRRWDLAGRVRELEPLDRLRRWRNR